MRRRMDASHTAIWRSSETKITIIASEKQ